MRTVVLALTVMLLIAGVARAVDEPDGFRLSDYDAPVPETLQGAHVVGDEAAHALWLSGRVVIFDVMPDLPRPDNLPKSVLWQGRKRNSIPGAIWLPYAGFGELDAVAAATFEADLARHTDGDQTTPILFLCRADCWMSWNAAKRAVALGYARVFWYPQGTTGWDFWDWPTERLRKQRR